MLKFAKLYTPHTAGLFYKHTRYNSHFPGQHGLASCPLNSQSPVILVMSRYMAYQCHHFSAHHFTKKTKVSNTHTQDMKSHGFLHTAGMHSKSSHYPKFIYTSTLNRLQIQGNNSKNGYDRQLYEKHPCT